ncbi:MAG: hypothetical protein JJU28_17895 [Cyclobacteriaceae bacterium]|nr:hypothetical protein [Cyclobacteriaceae bacterium]
MRSLFFYSLLCLFILNACAPKISTQISSTQAPLQYDEEVVVLSADDHVPVDAEFIGKVKISDSGLTLNCGYEVVLEKAVEATRKAGGNVLQITEHKLPNMGSSCHRIAGNIYRVQDAGVLAQRQAELEESLIEGADYALLHVYRYSGAGSAIGYDLYLGDSVICRVKNNFKASIKIYKDGMNTLWAKTEAKKEVPVDIEMGKEYFLRCSVTMGAFVGHPKLELVPVGVGRKEFESFNAKNTQAL